MNQDDYVGINTDSHARCKIAPNLNYFGYAVTLIFAALKILSLVQILLNHT